MTTEHAIYTVEMKLETHRGDVFNGRKEEFRARNLEELHDKIFAWGYDRNYWVVNYKVIDVRDCE